jgi:glycerol-3-phosphate O-acyltransferase
MMRLRLTHFPAKLVQNIRTWFQRAFDGTHNHYSCYLPDRLGRFPFLILRLFYSGIKLDKSQTDIIDQIDKDAIIIYVTKFHNPFELMFFYSRCRQQGLPFPQIAFDYRVFIWQPLSRIVKILLAHVDYFLRNFSLPDPYKSGFIKQELINGRCGYLSLVGSKVFYRRFVKFRTDPLQYLIELQKTIERPIIIVPQLLFLTKTPQRTQPTLIDMIFGSEHKPGRIRRWVTLFRNPDKVFVETSKPVNLRHYLEPAEVRDKSVEYQALLLRRDLMVQLNRHRQSITGPIIKTREELKEAILTQVRFRQFMDEYAEDRDIPLTDVTKKAAAYIEEIAAQYNPSMLKIYSAIVGWIIRSIFDGAAFNKDVLEKIKRMSLKGPLVLIPCHKSHIDYLILSYIMYHNNMPCPFIAAGKNLSFWPLGPLFRSGGAFFIRRRFKGAVLYSRVFSEYIYKLLEEGFNIEQFIEGGRSRTGKLLMPKLGLLSILLKAYKDGACEDMIIVPIYIGYDRVLEEKSYLHELEGGKKEPENLRQVIQARKFLKKRYGKIYIRFHDPISLNELLARFRKPYQEMDSTEHNALCRNLGHRVIHAISRVAVVTPHGLVASAILNCSQNRFSSNYLMSTIETYLRYLGMQNATLADTLVYDNYQVIQHVLNSYVQRKFVRPDSTSDQNQSSEMTYTVNTEKRSNLEYYKNNCVAFFVPASFTAFAILEKGTSSFAASDLHERYTFLQNFFKYEFAYDVDRTIADYVQNNLNAFIDNGILAFDQNSPQPYAVTPAGQRKLYLFSEFLKTYFESYWVVLSFYMQHRHRAIKSKDRLKKVADTGNAMFKNKEIERKEAINKVSFQNAITFFNSRGIKGSDNVEKIDFYAETIKHTLKFLNQ